jgi:putative ABC transport system permease protein
MLRSYLITALRNLLKYKLYTGINVFGLAFSLALCFFVIGHISYELSFEDFQENKDNIYRVEAEYEAENWQYKIALFSPVFCKTIVSEIPEIVSSTIFRKLEVTSVRIGEERYRVINEHEGEMHSHGNKLFVADSGYFNVFTFPLVQGDPKTALQEPNTLLISENAARQYFPNSSAVGQTIIINDTYECHITGILKDTPYNTQHHTDFIMSYKTVEDADGEFYSWSHDNIDRIYFILDENVDPAGVTAKIESIKNQYFPPEEKDKYSIYLMPFNDLMFRGFPGAFGDLNPRAEPSLIITIALVAAFIVLMAIANFINLATAKSSDRIREVGVRKVMGAQRKQLLYQFLGESILITIISSVISLFLYELIKWRIQGFLSREMLVDFYNSPVMIIGVIVVMFTVGILAGLYPALFLSRFKPIAILQSKVGIGSAKSLLRKSLVVLQFAIAAVFVFLAYVIYNQSNLITSTDLGFDTENVLLLDFEGDRASEDCQLMKNEILSKTNAVYATATSYAPGRETHSAHRFFTTEERRQEETILVKLFDVDYDFTSATGLEIIEGRGFSPEHPEDYDHGLIINESAKKELEVDRLLGHKLYRKDGFFEVIGVVKDFHGTPLNFYSRPVKILRYKPEEYNTLMIKLPDDNIQGSIASIKRVYEAVLPDEQFAYYFLDDEIAKNYSDLRGQTTMFLFLCFVTIGIACLGIFGLVSFTAEKRSKEIGIRKIMGASVNNIISMLSKEFVILIFIACLIGWPIAFMMSRDFLSYYPIRTNIGIGTFVITALIAMVFAMISAGSQAYKAARANPADVMRSE